MRNIIIILGLFIASLSTQAQAPHWVQICVEGETIVSGPVSFSAQAGTGTLWSPVQAMTSSQLPLYVSWASSGTVLGLGADPAYGKAKLVGVIQTNAVQTFVVKSATGVSRTVNVMAQPVSQVVFNDSAIIITTTGTQSLTVNEVAAIKAAASDPILMQLASDGIALAHGVPSGTAYTITYNYSAQVTHVP